MYDLELLLLIVYNVMQFRTLDGLNRFKQSAYLTFHSSSYFSLSPLQKRTSSPRFELLSVRGCCWF